MFRLISNIGKWKIQSFGYCYSCGRYSVFLKSKALSNSLDALMKEWNPSREFQLEIQERENGICVYCRSNYRMRALATTVLELMNLQKTRNLVRLLKDHKEIIIYESSNYCVFRHPFMRNLNNYQTSEYFSDTGPGNYLDGVRNENLEHLSFDDESFDIVITSDVLEHVSNMEKCLGEIKRVLKLGGFHVFTIPVDHGLGQTMERAVVTQGDIIHNMKPIFHGDTIRKGGILAFRDFGKDVLTYLTRPGMECREKRFYIGNSFSTSVYYARKA